MRYSLRTLLAWPFLLAAWATLLIKWAQDMGPSPAYPNGRRPELLVLGVMLFGLTAAVAYWTFRSSDLGPPRPE